MSWQENEGWQKFKKANTGKMGIIISKVSETIMLNLDNCDINKINAKQMIKEADKYGEVTRIVQSYIAQAILEFHLKGKEFIKSLDGANGF